MAGNRGKTSLNCKRRIENPMADYDRLPRELRAWIADADLPWRPKSVRRSFERALSQTEDKNEAIEELSRLQRRLITKDAKKVWGEGHPAALE